MKMKPNSGSNAFTASAAAKATLLMLTLVTLLRAEDGISSASLNGIGYLNLDEGYTGVTMASFGGGTELIIKGKGFNVSPASNLIQYDEDNDDNSLVIGPDLSEDNNIRSCPHNGVLQYTTPSIGTLYGMEDSVFDGEETMNMYLSVYAIDDDTGGYNELYCPTSSYCKVKLSRYYTPLLYEVVPPVQYAWSNNTYVFDPAGCQDLKQTDELAFVSIKVDNSFISFEEWIDEDTWYSGFYRNYVSGTAGENSVNTTSMPEMFFYPGRATNTMQQMTTCSFDNEVCYQMMTVAKIDSVSMPEGYTSGGQNLSIQGYGFTHGNISISVAGVDCEVTSFSEYGVNCETGASDSESSWSDTTVGGQGVRYSQYNYSSWIGLSSIDNYSPTAEYIHTALASTFNVGDWMSAKYSGFFKAPKTTTYRFYMTCDDQCSFDMSLTDMDTSDLTNLLTVTGYSDYKEWDKNDGQVRISDWVQLNEGEHYYFELKHVEGSWTDFVQVGVEIETDFPDHHHNSKEVQRVGVDPLRQWQTTRFNMSNCDDLDIYLAFMDPNGEYWPTEEPFTCGCSASTFKSAIKDYYSTFFGTSISVERWSYDADGNETSDADDIVSYTYNVTMDKLLSGETTSMIMTYNTESASTVDVEYSSMVQESSTPLGGRMKLRCYLEDGSYQDTESMSYDVSQAWLQYKLNNGCTYFRNKVRVETDDKYSYDVNGQSFLFYFEGFNGQPGLFEFMSDDEDPLTGDEITFPSEVVRAYSTMIFYDNIPFEMLYTAETVPQVEVFVDGVPAVCAGLDCGFGYFDPSYEITDVMLQGSDLTIYGTLPTDIVSADLGGVVCEDMVSDGSQASCTLPDDPTAGIWHPIVKDAYGIIPIEYSCPSVTVNLVIDSISIMVTELNSLGQDYMWVYGSGFPITEEPGEEDLYIQFSDGTYCDVLKSEANTMLCLTQPFSSTSLGQTLTISVYVNGVSDDSQSVTISSQVRVANSVSPASYSPVLKTNVQIFFDDTLDYTLETEDLYVTLYSTFDDSSYDFNVVAVDNDPDIPSVTFRYGGAWSGVYDIQLYSETYGLVDTAGLTFEAVGTITDFYPSTIGIHGGALITIQGYHFGDVYTDNPVKVGRDTYCYVQETSEYEIKCRVDEEPSFEAGDEDLLVFLRTSEEATCSMSDCLISIIDSGLPSVSSMTAYWDDVTQKHLISIQGSGSSQDIDDIEFKIDGFSQIIQSVSQTEVIVEVNNTLGTSSTDLKFYTLEGIPDGHSIIEAGISLDPKILAIYPQTGSTGGSVVNATVSGVGTETEGVTLVDSSGNDMCQEVSIPEWGVVSCLTVSGDLGFTVLSLEVSGSITDCIDSYSCEYGQNGGQMPAVSGANINADTEIVFSGTNFLTSFSGFASFAGIEADSVTIDSDSQATATWNLGVPIGDELPVLQFVLEDDTWETHYADMGSAYVYQSLEVSGSSVLECSFNGGCMLEIDSVGLASSMKNSEHTYLTVCEQTCAFNEDLSTASTAVCELQSLRTTYSQDTFEITEFGYLNGTLFGSANTQVENVFDEDNLNTNEDWDSDCYFGMYFPEGYEGFVSEVKLFLGSTYSKDYFVDHLTFQGSDDGNSYDDLFTLDASIHEGWNYFDFEEGEEVSYRFYRFFGSNAGACLVNEAHIFGVEVINDSSESYACTPHLYQNDAVTLLDDVWYVGAITPALESISPRYGSVYGGDSITFTGERFSDDISKVSVWIDDIECEVTSATNSEIVCTTGDKPGLSTDPSLKIYIDGVGLVANGDNTFYYVYLWSDENTWGGEFVPAEGDSVHIPTGMNVLFDMDSTPVLNIIIVEGALIFAPDADPDHERSFDCHYFLVSHGVFQVGTEGDPYTSKMTFTMYGEKADPSLPIFGNKVLAVHYGTLDIHGVERYPTWTELELTADVGATQLTLREAVDWQVGEEIVIAPTSFEAREAEQRTIIAIDNSNPDNPVLTLDTALANKHFAGTEYFDDDFIDIRAEVGLLTRNVKYQGDPEFSEPNQYGATIMLHSDGDDTSKGRISYTELTNCGQAFKVGKYPIHFHMIGYVSQSFVRGNAIHQSFNRATTIHGVHGLTIQNNVIYKTMGHNIFIEDAAETNNIIEYNLLVQTMRSWSLLNTDQTPGSMWITHPDNIIRYNHAAGSDRYSYWYDLQETAIGPSFDPNICPINAKLGEFIGNVAHSNGRYGLRIFHGLRPRTFPCQGLNFDSSTPDDPFHENPLITANFYDLVAWKNKRNGAITERTGDVRFHNFKTADNILAGIEFSLTNNAADSMAGVYGGLIVGKTSNTEDLLEMRSPHGIITPRTENFTVDGTKFYNFNWKEAAAFGTCSHCFHPASTDSGARTMTTTNLYMDDSVTRRIKYQYPFRAIFHDLDGTLTGQGEDSYASFNWPHLHQPECVVDEVLFDGVACNNEVQIRRVAWHDYDPSHFDGMDMKIYRWDDDDVAAMSEEEKETYLENHEIYSLIPYKAKLDPKGWAVPYVTGHHYRMHWQTGLDFLFFTMTLSDRWNEDDRYVKFVMNFTDPREAVNITNVGLGELVPNDTIASNQNNWDLGNNIIYNDTETREIHVYASGKHYDQKQLTFLGLECLYDCYEAVEEVELETDIRLWSDPESWTSGVVPVEGDYVEIESGWNMHFDLEESPILDVMQVNGRLTIPDDMDHHIRVKHLYIRAGELLVGTAEEPFQHDFQITLHGEKQSEGLKFDNTITAGNKVMVNTNRVEMYGKSRTKNYFRLLETANLGDDFLVVEAGLDLVEGDALGLLPTGMDFMEYDYAWVTAYDAETGVISIDRQLQNLHWGAAESTEDTYGVDMRGEVLLLSRNVRIVGEDIESWGGHFLTADKLEADLTLRSGMTILDNVEVYNCSQQDTFRASLRFEGATNAHSSVTNSAIYGGIGWALNIQSASNVHFQNNMIFNFKAVGVSIWSASNITFDSNVIGGITEREFGEGGESVDKWCAVCVCTYFGSQPLCPDVQVTNNIAGGARFAGFTAQSHECDDYSTQKFKNNIAHSIKGHGARIYPDPSDNTDECYEGSHFIGYKNSQQSMLMWSKGPMHVRMTNIISIDNAMGITAMGCGGGTLDEIMLEISDTTIWGETEAPDSTSGNTCLEKMGLMLSGATKKDRDMHPLSPSKLPAYKIKSDAEWNARHKFFNLEFKGWNSKETQCGKDQYIFGLNPFAADYIHRSDFYSTHFDTMDHDTLAYFRDPPQSWASISDCGNWPCTAPLNVLLNFHSTTYGPNSLANEDRAFQVISDNEGFSPFVDTCYKVDQWNGWHCTNDKIGMLVFQNLDDNAIDRTIQPIYYRDESSGVNNELNAFMDHIWDGFYTGQQRVAMFPGLIETDSEYEIVYTSTEPLKQKFLLYSSNGGVKITINYMDAGVYRVLDENQNQIEPNDWDTTISREGEIKGNKGCGENRFQGVEKQLQFYITDECLLHVSAIDMIMCNVRLDWSFDEFYASGGTTTFADRITAALGIHSSQVKVASVYEGSVVVDFYVTADDDDEDPEETLTTLETELYTQLSDGSVDLGAPVLEVTFTNSYTGSSTSTETEVNYGEDVPDIEDYIIEVEYIDVIIEEEAEVIELETETTTTIDAFQEGLIDDGKINIVYLVPVLVIVMMVVAFTSYLCLSKKKQAPVVNKMNKTSPRGDSEVAQGQVVQQRRKSQEFYEDQFDGEEDLDIFDFDSKKVDKVNQADQLASNDQLKGSSENVLKGTANDTYGIQDSEQKLVMGDSKSGSIKYDSSSLILDSKNHDDLEVKL